MVLADALRLSAFERDLLLFAAAAEFDPSIPARCAAAAGDARLDHPTFALALEALPDAHWAAFSPQATLRHLRLVEIAQPPGRALTTSALRADESVVAAIKGLDEPDDRLAGHLVAVPAAPLAAGQAALLEGIARRWQAGVPRVQLVGPHRGTTRAVAAACGRPVLGLSTVALPLGSEELDTVARLISRELRRLDGVLFVEMPDEPHDALGRLLAGVEGLVLLGTREVLPSLGAAVLEVPRAERAEQRAAWARGLDPAAVGVADALTGRFDLDPTAIAEVLAANPPEPGADADRRRAQLWEACRMRIRPRLDALAVRVRPAATWDDLVLPETELALLHAIADQVTYRSTVYEEWGFGTRMDRGTGVSVLFAGPSGTGKTMAAGVLANALGLDLYRVDLAAVASKYIGEMEKNLRRIFDAADDGSAVLLFDEADALFGKRSEVKDSHDRYANYGVADLLARMEAYRGLAVLTTNMRSALDPAFLRRLRSVVTFPFPDDRDRVQLWERALPRPEHLERDGLDLERLAAFPFTGASINAVVLTAAFAAAARPDPDTQRVSMADLLDAARTECRKLGLPIPDERFLAVRAVGAAR
nr:ATP-binding protein [Actinomycetospora cinnamomea]